MFLAWLQVLLWSYYLPKSGEFTDFGITNGSAGSRGVPPEVAEAMFPENNEDITKDPWTTILS
jgi:hypothetical protein